MKTKKLTSGHYVELRSGLHDLATFLGKLILEPLLVGGRRFTYLLELSLKVDDTLFFLLCMPQLVGSALGPFRQRLLQNHKVVSNTSRQSNQTVIVQHNQLIMSVWLMVTMLVCKARMSSLSSNQGVIRIN
jgi:hypothetical protein